MDAKKAQRRKERLRERARHAAGAPRTGADPAAALRAAAHAVEQLVLLLAAQQPPPPEPLATALLRPGQPWSSRDLDRAVDGVLVSTLERLWRGGWQPRDLAEVVRRRQPRAVAVLAAAVALSTARRRRAEMDHRWWSQVVEMGADRPPPAEETVLDGGRQRLGAPAGAGPAALAEALELLVVLSALPRLDVLLPPPGAPGVHAEAQEPRDEGARRALSRVRGLLAKAESTEIPEEAELLSAKAQELMARHDLERLVVEAGRPRGLAPTSARRVWLEAPYVTAKAMLVGQVAAANRCRAVQTTGLDCVTVVGDERALDAVELLSTSLLVQATRALVEAGRAGAGARSRSRGYRSSFLTAYAARVGERLSEAATSAQAAAARETGGALLPALVAAEQRVDAELDRLFPGRLRRRSVSVTDAAGWSAGRSAADRARLGTGEALQRPAA